MITVLDLTAHAELEMKVFELPLIHDLILIHCCKYLYNHV